MEISPGVIRKIPLRNVQVTDSFVGIDAKGKSIKSEFLALANDLEPNYLGLDVDIINV